MLDTVGIKIFYRSLDCEDFTEKWQRLSGRKDPTWIHNAKGEKVLPNLTMIYTSNGLGHLSARVSLPKMLFGHNARLPNQAEVNHGLQLIGEYIEQESGLEFDVSKASVSTVHFAYDVHLDQSEVLPTIYRLSERTMKRKEKLLYNDSTLYFQTKNKAVIVRIYSKLLEVLSRKKASAEEIELARGVLRFEYCLSKTDVINSFVKRKSLPDRLALTLLNEDVSISAISDIFDELNFIELLSDERSDLEKLREHFSTRQSFNILGFLKGFHHYGEHFYKDESLGFSKAMYYNDVKKCRKAKVWKSKKPFE